MKKIFILALAFFIAAGIVVFCFRQVIVKHGICIYLKSQIKSDIEIDKADVNSWDSIDLYSMRANNINGLDFAAGSGRFTFNTLTIFREGVKVRFALKDVRLDYKDSKIVSGIFDALSVGPMDTIEFSSIEGEFSRSKGQFMLRSLNASGQLMALSAYGISNDTILDYNIKMELSEALTSGIPESVKKVFFKQEGENFHAELHVAGNINNPSISFSTDLFTFTVS
jgi:hypothetical protein